MRHGQTLFNLQHKIQGWCDAPLTQDVYKRQGMTREICGTLTGGAMVLGQKFGKEAADVKQKQFVNKKVASLCKEFEESHGSVICGELLGLRETDKKVNRQTCDELIEEVVRLLEKYMVKEEIS